MLTLHSFRIAEPHASLIVLTDTPHLLERHRAAVPRLTVQPYNLTVLRTIEHLDRELQPGDAGWFRFPLMATYIQRYCRRAELVLLFDLKDVLFQTSPFALAPRSPTTGEPLPTLTSFTEYFKMRRWTWNHMMMLPFNKSFPNLIELIMTRHVRALNNGLLLGPPRVVERHVRELSAGVLGLRPPPAKTEGLDQGLHNLLVYSQHLWPEDAAPSSPPTLTEARISHTVIPMNFNATSPVLTMHAMPPTLYACDEHGLLRSRASGATYVIVHQWNRAPETVQRAILCRHRHLLSTSKLRCDPFPPACHPTGLSDLWKPSPTILQQEEREIILKVSYPRTWWSLCPARKCITAASERVTLL